MKLHKEKANFVKCPMIKESPVSIECKVKEIKKMGSHHMFIADVLAINADDKYIDEKGAFDISKCNLIAYANGGYYQLGKKMGSFGYSVIKKKTKAKQKNKDNNKNAKRNFNNKKDYKVKTKKSKNIDNKKTKK